MEKVSKRAVSALQAFDSGYNCAQSVILAYCESLHIDKKVALQMACGFGAGMGRLQKTCGAVTGAFMAIGAATCKSEHDNNQRKEVSYARVQEFQKKFEALHGSTDCSSLLGVDLNTEEGHRLLLDRHLRETVCKTCISSAVAIADELIA